MTDSATRDDGRSGDPDPLTWATLLAEIPPDRMHGATGSHRGVPAVPCSAGQRSEVSQSARINLLDVGYYANKAYA